MGGESFIVLRNLLAQVFLFNFEECFRVLFFESRNEEAEEAANKIADALEHDEEPVGGGGG